MARHFPFVDVPSELELVVGTPDTGTRIYRREGAEEDVGQWFDILCEMYDNLVSPGGVSMYAPASRAAVYKRLQEGNLTAFAFHSTTSRKAIFTKKKRLTRSTPIVYIPVSECKAWGEELKDRMARKERITRGELEGTKPEWIGDFWEWRSKWRKERNPREDDK